MEWALWARLLQLCGPDGWPGAAGGALGGSGREVVLRACRIALIPRLGVIARASSQPEPIVW